MSLWRTAKRVTLHCALPAPLNPARRLTRSYGGPSTIVPTSPQLYSGWAPGGRQYLRYVLYLSRASSPKTGTILDTRLWRTRTFL